MLRINIEHFILSHQIDWGSCRVIEQVHFKCKLKPVTGTFHACPNFQDATVNKFRSFAFTEYLEHLSHQGGFFHSKGTWGCAALKCILFRTSSLAKGILFRRFGPATV